MMSLTGGTDQNIACQQVEAGSDAPSESKLDQRMTSPAENGVSHTPVIAPKPPSVVGQTQSAGVGNVNHQNYIALKSF